MPIGMRGPRSRSPTAWLSSRKWAGSSFRRDLPVSRCARTPQAALTPLSRCRDRTFTGGERPFPDRARACPSTRLARDRGRASRASALAGDGARGAAPDARRSPLPLAGERAALGRAALVVAQPRARGELANGRRRQRHLRGRRGRDAGHRFQDLRERRNAGPRLSRLLSARGRARPRAPDSPRRARPPLLRTPETLRGRTAGSFPAERRAGRPAKAPRRPQARSVAALEELPDRSKTAPIDLAHAVSPQRPKMRAGRISLVLVEPVLGEAQMQPAHFRIALRLRKNRGCGDHS